jgi:hypothetical protein
MIHASRILVNNYLQLYTLGKSNNTIFGGVPLTLSSPSDYFKSLERSYSKRTFNRTFLKQSNVKYRLIRAYSSVYTPSEFCQVQIVYNLNLFLISNISNFFGEK